MKLPEFCIQRPVFATVLSLIIILIGAFAYTQIPTRATPKMPQRYVLIYSNYSGASSQLMETNITLPLEQSLSSIPGIANIQSQSTRNTSQIQIEVQPNANFNEVVEKIRNEVQQAQGELPNNMNPPQVLSGGFNDNALIDIAFWSKERSLSSIRNYVKNYIANKIKGIDGVSSLSIGGVSEPAMRIWLSPDKMSALKISPEDVQTAISNANQSLPAGTIHSLHIDYPITANTLLQSAAQFNNIVIKNVNGQLIRIRDIGHAAIGTDSGHEATLLLNNQPFVDVFVNYINGTSNPIVIGNQVDKLLKEVQPLLPPDIHMLKFLDFSTFLRHSVHEVYSTIGIAIIFVCLVIFLFLGSLRAAVIPIVTIPICLIGTVALLYFLGLSLNTITLLALVLSVGLIVDDSIVVVENTHRHIERGLLSKQAAMQGSREISTPIIAMTLTLVAVFAPIMFIQGEVASFIRSFAIALAGSVLISGFVALTLSPTMCAYMLPDDAHHNSYARLIDKIFAGFDKAYHHFLSFVLQIRLLILILVVAIAAFGVYLYNSIPKNYFPSEDVGWVEIYFTPMPGANLQTMQSQLKTVYQHIKSLPSIQDIALNAETGYSTPYAHIFMALKPLNKRTLSANEVATKINNIIKTLPGISAYAQADASGMNYQHGFEFALLSQGSYKSLAVNAQQVIQKLKAYPGLMNLDSAMKFNTQEYQINVNETMAGQYNVSHDSINNALAIFLGGIDSSTKFVYGDNLYNIIIQAGKKYQKQISVLNNLYIRNNNGDMVPLGSVVSVKLINSMDSLNHYDLERSGSIYGQLAPGYSMGQVINDLKQLFPKILPHGTRYAFTGAAHDYLKSTHDTTLLFFAALIFIYLILAALFESFIDPLTILLAVPLCIISALTALRYTGGSVNIYTQIGLVSLIGLIAKHGILITQFANTLQKNGVELIEAITTAAAMRLRPILMTTLAMICGALPLILATGAGANSRFQLGIIIIAGLLFGTFFSLIVVPVAYSILHPLKRN